MATVFPGASVAGVIAVEMWGRNEREESWAGGRRFPGGVLGFDDDAPFGRRKMLKAILSRRNTEKMEASGSFCSSSST